MSESDLKIGEFRVNGLHHSILQILTNGQLTSTQLYDSLPTKFARHLSVGTLVTDVTSVMVVDKLLSYVDGKWNIEQDGFSVLNFLDSRNREAVEPSIAAKKEYTVPSGYYDGAELRDTCLRKGAYDFLALPSLYGGKSVEHRTAKAFLGEGYAKVTG